MPREPSKMKTIWQRNKIRFYFVFNWGLNIYLFCSARVWTQGLVYSGKHISTEAILVHFCASVCEAGLCTECSVDKEDLINITKWGTPAMFFPAKVQVCDFSNLISGTGEPSLELLCSKRFDFFSSAGSGLLFWQRNPLSGGQKTH